MRSYFSFLIQNWRPLKSGDIIEILKRPDMSFSRDRPVSHELSYLKEIIEKSEYKFHADKYGTLHLPFENEPFNNKDELMPETKYDSIAWLFVDQTYKLYKDSQYFDP